MRVPIRVLHFSNSTARGGVEEHMLTLLRGLDRPLFRLYLACPPDLAALLGTDVPSDVRIFPVALNKPTQFREAIRLARFLRSERIDILHSHLFYASLFASPVGWLCRVPAVIETPHVRELWRRGWKSHYFVDRVAGWFVDAYIAVSEANARYLADAKRLPRRKIVVVRNGTDLNRFNPLHHPPPLMRKELGFSEEDPVLVTLARLEPQKGHDVLLDALVKVRAMFPNVRLVCVGDGSLREQLVEKATSLGLADTVRFVGFQTNVADWLALSTFTVLPSRYEGLPLVAIESLAAGRPVVATAVDGTPEVVVDGVTGLTVPPGQPDLLAKAILRLLADQRLLNELAANGSAWVSEHFNMSQQVVLTQKLYLDVIGTSQRDAARNLQRLSSRENSTTR